MLKKWCEKTWLPMTYALGVTAVAALAINWGAWDLPRKFVCFQAALLPMHVLEEWQLPGGFHYSYNALIFRSEVPERYPMSTLTDMITNFVGELFFLLLTFLGPSTGVILALTIFSAMEAVIHNVVGYLAWRTFRGKGKRTIYAPGSATAVLGFAPAWIAMTIWLADTGVGLTDIPSAALTLGLMLIGMILIPESLLKREDSIYAYPDHGYYEKFLR